jgi:uncharacterized repeat protein (TIGR01451 family)
LTTPVNTATASADLSVSQVASPNPAIPGNNQTYTVTVTNNGPSAVSDVVLTDQINGYSSLYNLSVPLCLDNAVAMSPSQGGCTFLTHVGSAYCGVSCALGSIAAGGSATVNIMHMLNTDDMTGVNAILNTASVTSSTPDPNQANNSSTLNIPIAPSDLVVTQTASPNPATVGSNLTYTFTVTNTGLGSKLADVLLTDTITDAVTIVSMTCANNGYSAKSLGCAFRGGLLPGASNTATLVVIPTAAGTLTNTVSVITSSTDTNPANNTSTIQTQVNNMPSGYLSITKNGTGTVMSNPSGISCNDACLGQEAYFPIGTVISLAALPPVGGSIFTGWTGDSDCSDGRMTMNTSGSCVANFDNCGVQPALIYRTRYGSIGDAYTNAEASGDTIKLIASNQQETLNFNSSKNITLSGVYDCFFVNEVAYTTVTGSLTISDGKVSIEKLKIKP